MTREQNIDALAGAIRRLIEALIAGDQRVIGSHQNLTDARQNLRDALRAALGGIKESAQ
jgi:putative NIF3 family GTP cyclohydrolase 1 type 2